MCYSIEEKYEIISCGVVYGRLKQVIDEAFMFKRSFTKILQVIFVDTIHASTA